MSNMKYTVVGLGELLWDLFQSGKQLGGATANFAYHAALLGDSGITASRVGMDGLGMEAIKRLQELGVTTDFIQIDPEHRTSVVDVEIDREGQPKYSIAENVAWDFLEWSPEWQKLAARADAVCFGSLAQRCPASRAAIRRFLKSCRPAALRVFDVNLREPFYSEDTITASFEMSGVVKLSEEELDVLGRRMDLEGDSSIDRARFLIEHFPLKLVCITRGTQGCLLVDGAEVADHPGFPAVAADTVGAGDAFTAALVHHFLRGSPLPQIAERANLLASWVVTHSGATPAPDEEVLSKVRAVNFQHKDAQTQR